MTYFKPSDRLLRHMTELRERNLSYHAIAVVMELYEGQDGATHQRVREHLRRRGLVTTGRERGRPFRREKVVA